MIIMTSIMKKSSKKYFTEFAQDLVKNLKKFNIINIRSVKVYGLGKLTTIKVTAKNKAEVATVIKAVKSFCVSKKLKNIKLSESLCELQYGYLKNGDYENSIDYDFYVDVHKQVLYYEEWDEGTSGKNGYILLIHADTL